MKTPDKTNTGQLNHLLYSDYKFDKPRIGNIIVNPRRGGEWIVRDISDGMIHIENPHTKEKDSVKSIARLIIDQEILMACGFKDNGDSLSINHGNGGLLIDKKLFDRDEEGLLTHHDDLVFHRLQNIFYHRFNVELDVTKAVEIMVEYRNKKKNK